MVWITASKIDDRLLLPTETKAPNVDKELPKMWQCMAWPPPTFLSGPHQGSEKASMEGERDELCAVTPKGVLPPALCNASATPEVP